MLQSTYIFHNNQYIVKLYVEKVIEANSQKLLGRENIGRSLYVLFWNFSKIEIDKRAIFLTSLLI